MKYIKIKNNGNIDPQALQLVGASSKVGDHSKIGQFGSGNKYALAFLLRNDYAVYVYSGLNEIPISTHKQIFRDIEFDVIHINGEKTSITTEMGKDWEFWQAIREIYCNAIDEGGAAMEFVQDIKPVDGETHFYIDNKKDAAAFIVNFDNYFATNKKVLFECESGRILEKSGNEMNLYRKGIKCYLTPKGSIYDYDLNDIDIDENRLVKYSWTIDEKIWDLIYQCTDEEVIRNVLLHCSDTANFENQVNDYSSLRSNNVSDVFRKVLRSINVAPLAFGGLLKPDELHNHVLIPTRVFSSLRPILDDENVGARFKINSRGTLYKKIDPLPLHRKTLKSVLGFFEDCRFIIPYAVSIAVFEDKKVFGCVDGDQIIISDICIEQGVNETVNTIIEEFIHIKYKARDESRSFQTGIISEFITYMKSINEVTI